MKKLTLLFALLCASVMGWSYDIAPSTTFGGHYQWQEIDGVTPPANVVNVQPHGGFDCLYITFADAGFNRDNIVGGEVFTDAGAQAWLKLASYTDASTDVYFYKTGSTTEIRWGLRILNTEAGSGSSFDPASIDWNNVDFISGQSQYKIYFTEENRPSNWETINIQTAPWAGNNTGIYVTTPDGVSACSLGDKVGCWMEGAQVLMYLTAFVDEVTEVTITHASGTKTLYVYNANAGSGSSTPVSDPNEYTASGHTIHLDAYYVDIDGTNKNYTLDITSTDDMSGLGGSYWSLSTGNALVKANITISSDKKKITCTAVSSSNPSIYTPLYVLFPGEVNFGDVTLNWEDRTPIASEYCNYQGSETQQDGHYYAITWQTDPSGNVVITIGNGTGAGACSYRNGGFEGGNNGLDNFVVSDDNFVTTTPASDYFTVTRPSDGDLEYVLTKKADLPENAKIKHLSAGAIAWREAGVDRYCFPEFIYTYGGVCVEPRELTSIGLTASSSFAQVGEEVTLTANPLDQFNDPIEVSINYEVSPADAGNFVGNVFTFAKLGAATITAKSGDVQSNITIYGVPSENLALNKDCEGGYYDNNPAEGYNKANDGNTGTQWVTYADQATSKEWWYVDLGDVYSLAGISVVWGADYSTNYKLFARTDAPSDEQKADDSAWEEIASETGATAGSEQFKLVNVNARYVRIHSLSRSGNCIRLKELRVFGTEYVPVVDTEKPVMTSASLSSSTYTEAVVNVAATDNVGIYRYHVVDAGNSIDANFAESEGKITINNLTHGTEYHFTITAKDAAGNESDNNIVVNVTTPFDASVNLALNQPCEAGYYDNNPAESADKANDGNNGTSWVTYGDHAAALDWWVVDLGKVYNLTNITALWANDAYATQYMLQARVDAPTDEDKANDAAWVTLETVSGVTAGEEKSTDVSGVGRYVRFRALAHTGFFRLRELRVYASGVATVDTEAPVMTSASLVSNTDVQAVIAVAATDNQGIANYHVVDAGNSFDANFAAEAGNITVTGLTGGTNYNLAITAIDFFGNESENSKSVAVTTTAHYTAPQAACPAPTWDAALVKAMYSPTYSANYNHQDWGSGTVATEDEFGRKYVTNDNGYFGADGFALNCLLMEKLHYDIWIENDATVRFVPIWGGAEQGVTKALVGQQWNSIDIDLTEYTNVTNWGNVTQMKIDYAKNLTFWVANAYFYREAAYVDNVAPTNVSASKVAEGFYSVSILAQAEDNSGAVSFKVMNGDVQLATGAAASGAATTIVVNGLASGTNYNFNVIAYDEAGNEAEPVVVAAETKFMPAAAPAPDFGNKKVVAVFTDAMACAVSGIQSGGWGETTQVEWLDIAEGDKVFYAQNFNWAGWHSWGGGNIDATGMQYLHVDIYSTGMTAVNVTPISAGHEGSATINLTPNAWTSYDVPLSAYDANNIDWAHIFQFKFMGPVGGNELMIDNVYFWSYQVTPNAAQGTDAGGWATFAAPIKLAVPAGLTAYKASYEKTETEEILNLTPIDVIPANTGVILKGTASEDYILTPTDAEASDVSGNVLVGCVTRTDVSTERATKDIFCMRYSGSYDFTGFFLYEGQYVPANRAYLPLDKISGPNNAPRKVRFVIKGEQTTTGVENADSATVEAVKFIENGQMFIRRGEAVYNLQGVRVK